MDRSVLVTGGCGYIGSHTCKLLEENGDIPVVFDNLSTGNRWAVKWGKFVQGDLRNRHSIRKALETYKIDSVIHFASSALVGESMKYPYKYLHDNVSGSVTLLEAMSEVGVRRIVFSSSCATYGIPESVPIVETDRQIPVNPYGESKLFIERALSWYERARRVNWVALRYFNAAGADKSGEIGECHEPETHIIPLVIQAALGIRPYVEIFGTNYPTPDGTCVRDYVHVEDLASAHLKALQYLERGGQSIALNLGTSRGHSVREVIQAVERISGLCVPVLESPRRPGDPPVLVSDARMAQKVLSWRPKYKRLDNIVKTAWRWHTATVPSNVLRVLSQQAAKKKPASERFVPPPGSRSVSVKLI
jgi:UDP-glucose-4-epimerase GalE